MIMPDPVTTEFFREFLNERFVLQEVGHLNTDEDNFITRWYVSHGWKIKIQDCPDAVVEISLDAYPKFLPECLRWSRTFWRGNLASLLGDRPVWYRQPWCLYAVHISSFFNFALFYDAALLYTFYRTTLCVDLPGTMTFLHVLIYGAKLVKIDSHFIRHPENLIYIIAYIAFSWIHSVIKLYALLTFWVVPELRTSGDKSDDEDGESDHPTTRLAIEAPPSHPNFTDKDNDTDEDPLPDGQSSSPTDDTDEGPGPSNQPPSLIDDTDEGPLPDKKSPSPADDTDESPLPDKQPRSPTDSSVSG